MPQKSPKFPSINIILPSHTIQKIPNPHPKMQYHKNPQQYRLRTQPSQLCSNRSNSNCQSRSSKRIKTLHQDGTSSAHANVNTNVYGNTHPAGFYLPSIFYEGEVQANQSQYLEEGSGKNKGENQDGNQGDGLVNQSSQGRVVTGDSSHLGSVSGNYGSKHRLAKRRIILSKMMRQKQNQQKQSNLTTKTQNQLTVTQKNNQTFQIYKKSQKQKQQKSSTKIHKQSINSTLTHKQSLNSTSTHKPSLNSNSIYPHSGSFYKNHPQFINYYKNHCQNGDGYLRSSKRGSYNGLVWSLSKFLKGKQLLQSYQNILPTLQKTQLLHISQDIAKIQQIFKKPQIHTNTYTYNYNPNSSTTSTPASTTNITIYDTNFCDYMYRTYYNQIGEDIGKLLFFMGMEIAYGVQKEQMEQKIGGDWLKKIVRCLLYQIYFSIQVKVYNMTMEALMQCSRLYIAQNMFELAQYFCQVALKIAVRDSNPYYEEIALESISFCQCKQGNLSLAKILHDHASSINSQNRTRILKSYNEQRYLKSLHQHLFDGSQLNTKRSVRLVQTLTFSPNEKKYNPYIGTPSVDRLKIVKTNRSIHDFKRDQDKLHDLRDKSNQKAILWLRIKYLKGIQEINYMEENRGKQDVGGNQMSSLPLYKTLNRNRTQKVQNTMEENQKLLRIFREFLDFVEIMIKKQERRNTPTKNLNRSSL